VLFLTGRPPDDGRVFASGDNTQGIVASIGQALLQTSNTQFCFAPTRYLLLCEVVSLRSTSHRVVFVVLRPVLAIWTFDVGYFLFCQRNHPYNT